MKSKIKWVVGLTLPMLFLAGCTSIENSKNNTQEAPKEVKANQVSLKEYTDEAVRLRSEFNNAIKAFGEVRQDTKMEPKEWQTASLEKIKDIRAILNEFRRIAPPNSHKQVGEEITVALDEYDKGMELFEEAIKDGDASKDAKALEHMKTGQDYWNHAYRLLAIDNPIPPADGGDGTINTDDLKELDLNAGIDRDSVLLNVSKDGHELIGKWGFYQEDGSPNVSIVLNKDGSYEGYGNGEYPSKDNALIGTWKWNYIQGVITFHHDSKYVNGKKQEPNRKKMPMELQRYNEEGIQLFDLESMTSYKYEKIEDSEIKN
ncbi:DUF3994 domain-containing protein [Caldifermentibacillus hisashii]|uniref:DUF3994 domain-containing protein n=2 Tax=Caldifermentibacillus hisashii TaxID=996558 RepID=UPI0031011709